MKQVVQNLRNGITKIIDVPFPIVRPGHVLIRSSRTLISTGTERMMLDFGKAGWIEKARQQPEKIKQVIDKIQTDGVMSATEVIFNKLDEPVPLGYCNAGVVLEVGLGIEDLKAGDRVASNGPHAEVVCVPRNLCAKVPDSVSDEEATFTIPGSIALHGVRLAAPNLGERFMVFGLGLLGLLTVQFLRASGCPVLAVDVSETRLRLAEAFGASTVNPREGTDPVTAALSWTAGRGVDGVIIAASAKGDDIIHQAAQACRKRGRIILVGVVDLNLRRSDFYEKEISFQVSCSYGPGRYDEKYEQAGQDYPFGLVRWTEQRNFEAVVEALRSGKLNVKELITHRFRLEKIAGVYENALHNLEAMGIIIEYPVLHAVDLLRQAQEDRGEAQDRRTWTQEDRGLDSRLNGNKKISHTEKTGKAPRLPNVGVIGVGNYARSTLLPALRRTKAILAVVADINGVAAAHAARKFGAGKVVSDYRLLLDDPEIQAVFILTGHHLHARFVCDALEAGKHVFVEKPLALNATELFEITSLYSALSSPHSTLPMLMVGFNRRFSPHIAKIQGLLAGRTAPLCMAMTVNAGFISPEHWVQDPVRGGGRIIGEGCHFIDLLSCLAGSPVTKVSAMMVGGTGPIREDKMSILLDFADGSVGTVHYFANGAKSYPKEILEIFGDGRVIRMENFRITRGFGFKGFHSFRTWRQDKGHQAEIAAFMHRVILEGAPLISFNELVNVTRASFAAVESAKTGNVVPIVPAI